MVGRVGEVAIPFVQADLDHDIARVPVGEDVEVRLRALLPLRDVVSPVAVHPLVDVVLPVDPDVVLDGVLLPTEI